MLEARIIMSHILENFKLKLNEKVRFRMCLQFLYEPVDEDLVIIELNQWIDARKYIL